MKRTRNTLQRRAVLSAIERLDEFHPSAAEVFDEVKREHPRLSLATVYRSLDALCESGSVAPLKLEGVTRYCLGSSPHHHIVCRRCGAVRDVCTEVFPTEAVAHLEACSGFTLETGPMQFFGLCPDCR
jgi:Fe2+ or Zn2+ uptake regulation protein